ncbi:AAA family ATPase [Streptomyces sp. NRRL WC-3742]|uniref:AAA family ATPase n=1 Tax=Streptomyces sp. NRRL WC-3742 TaxID=1463934 RepID=UPI0004C634A1|nr:AAA family ATPase [Streptomyces sp. NRRL WC-3742]
MKIHSIAAQDFLSFASLGLSLKPGTTVVTGPNGAGKSNLSAAIALPLLVLERGLGGPGDDSDPLEVYGQAGRLGSDAYTVSLDIELDRPQEQELVRLFMEAAVVANAANIRDEGGSAAAASSKAVFALFTELGVAADSVQSLFRGTLQVAYAARHRSRWWAAWNFNHGEQQMQLILCGPRAGQLVQGQLPPWFEGAVASFRTASPLLRNVRLPIGKQTSEETVLRSFLRTDKSPHSGKAEPTAIDFGRILNNLDAARALVVDVPPLTNDTGTEPYALAALADALGREHGRNTRYDFRFVLAKVLRQGMVFTDNRRLPLARHFPLAEVGSPVDLRDGSAVAAELHRLKNGSIEEQQRFAQVRKVFHDITRLDLHLRSVPSPNAGLTIDILVGPAEGNQVAQFAGAGVQEALLLATLLAGEPGRVVVLDEPAVNLHPTVQRRLSRHLVDVQGIVITHSPDLIPCSDIADLDRVVRLTQRTDGTHVSSLTDKHREQLGAWMQRLLLADVRALLFASAVILCEGATELGALSQWWNQDPAGLGDPGSANIAMVDVGGEASFGGYINYLEAFGIPWAVVADGPAFAPTAKLGKQLMKLGLAPSDRPALENGFTTWRDYWNRAGIFTLADTFGNDGTKAGEIEAYLERLDKLLLEKVQAEHRSSKPRIGAAFAAAHPEMPAEVLNLYRQIHTHLNTRTNRSPGR